MDAKVGSKGMLADLLEREVRKETVFNGATSTAASAAAAAAAAVAGKELRISDNGLELIPKDARGFEVDMGVVGMNDIGVDLGDGGSAPKAAHLIAQVDDSGHVQIHLEEELDSSVSMCNGQSLLDQLEACEVSSSTDAIVAKGVKRPADPAEESGGPAVKKSATNHHIVPDGGAGILEKAIEMTLSESKDKPVVNGINGPIVSPPLAPPPPPPPVILGANAPRTFLILQPQNQQQSKLVFPPQGQRLLLAIQRPGGGVQHVAMPTGVVSIPSSQLQTNGAVVVSASSNGGVGTPVTTPITTVATASSGVVTTSSIEGVVTFSGGAVAFPARPAELSAAAARSSSNLAENHVTITPVSASVLASASASVPAPPASPASTVPVVPVVSAAAPTAVAVKKRNNSTEGATKARGRPTKSKSTDAPPAASACAGSSSHQPDSSFQYMCEWKDCMK